MRGTSTEARGGPVTAAALIARISAERDAPEEHTGRHRPPVLDVPTAPLVTASPIPAPPDPAPQVTGPLVTQGPPRRLTLLHRLAPVAVGAAVMLVVTTAAALVGAEPLPSSAGAQPGTALVTATATAVEEQDAAVAVTPRVAVPPAAQATVPAPVQAAAPPDPDQPAPAPAAQEPADGDEFDAALGPAWTVYDGEGAVGSRTPEAITVEDGVLVVRGDTAGNTGSLAWTAGSERGRWEVRARFPKGDERYRPVLMLWPLDGESPTSRRIEFAVGGPDGVSFALHHGTDEPLRAERPLDVTAWHDYAVELTPDGVTGFVDGEQWFQSTDPAVLPTGPMQATIQLDVVAGDGGPPPTDLVPTELQVDHLRISR